VSGDYPGLGFDPTPGEPGAVQAVLDAFVSAGEQISAVLPNLQSAVRTADGWEGDAAEEFSDYGDDIPNGLAEGAQSMGQAADALVAWFGRLVNNKAQTEVLDAMARKLKRQIEAAWDAVRDAQFTLDTAVAPKAVTAARTQRDAAANAVGTLEAQLQIVIDEARQLEQDHLAQADAAAAALRGAADGDAFQPVSWGSQAAGVAGNVLGEISTWTGRAAFVAALVPGGQVAAGVLAATSAATGVTGTAGKLYSRQQGAPNMANTSTMSLVLDGLLSVGGPAGKGVGTALGGLKEARRQAAELGAGGLSRTALRTGFTESHLGKAVKAFNDAHGANSVRDAMRRIGQTQADDLARLSDVEKVLKGTGMAGGGATDLATYADKADGGKGLNAWQKLPGKAFDVPALVTDAVNAGVREPFRPDPQKGK
jgi:uncharacterized protein YukE